MLAHLYAGQPRESAVPHARFRSCFVFLSKFGDLTEIMWHSAGQDMFVLLHGCPAGSDSYGLTKCIALGTNVE